MTKEDIITGIDIGTSSIRTVIAQKRKDKNSKLLVIGVGESVSSGMNNGIVVDVEETIESIIQSKEAAERTSGAVVENAYVSINGHHISSRFSKGVVAISRADGEISEEDVNRVINAAQAVSVPNNREIIDIIPSNYVIDGQENIKDPIGMNGIRLETNALIIEGISSFMKNVTKCVENCGIDVNELVFAPIAASKAVLSKRQKELGVVSVDIGKGITGVTVFEDGSIIHSAVIPIGAGHITNDIAIGMRISVDVAEKIKIEYGTSLSKDASKKDKIDLSEIDKNEEGVFNRKYVAEIVEARIEEIFFMVDKELKKIDRSGMLPSGVVITGGGAKMPGIVSSAKSFLRLPSQIGFPIGLGGVIDRVDDPSFATAVGLVVWGENNENKTFMENFRFFSLDRIGQKIKKVFSSILP